MATNPTINITIGSWNIGDILNTQKVESFLTDLVSDDSANIVVLCFQEVHIKQHVGILEKVNKFAGGKYTVLSTKCYSNFVDFTLLTCVLYTSSIKCEIVKGTDKCISVDSGEGKLKQVGRAFGINSKGYSDVILNVSKDGFTENLRIRNLHAPLVSDINGYLKRLLQILAINPDDMKTIIAGDANPRSVIVKEGENDYKQVEYNKRADRDTTVLQAAINEKLTSTGGGLFGTKVAPEPKIEMSINPMDIPDIMTGIRKYDILNLCCIEGNDFFNKDILNFFNKYPNPPNYSDNFIANSELYPSYKVDPVTGKYALFKMGKKGKEFILSGLADRIWTNLLGVMKYRTCIKVIGNDHFPVSASGAELILTNKQASPTEAPALQAPALQAQASPTEAPAPAQKKRFFGLWGGNGKRSRKRPRTRRASTRRRRRY